MLHRLPRCGLISFFKIACCKGWFMVRKKQMWSQTWWTLCWRKPVHRRCITVFSSLVFPCPTDVRGTGTEQCSKTQDVNLRGWEGACGFHSVCSPTMSIRACYGIFLVYGNNKKALAWKCAKVFLQSALDTASDWLILLKPLTPPLPKAE